MYGIIAELRLATVLVINEADVCPVDVLKLLVWIKSNVIVTPLGNSGCMLIACWYCLVRVVVVLLLVLDLVIRLIL